MRLDIRSDPAMCAGPVEEVCSMSAQSWNPDRYARHARFVAELGMPVLELLEPRPGERILDVGCGDGALTEKLVELGCEVVGIDSSSEQVQAARARKLDARVCDARELGFAAEFDAVFSNAALHWMPEAERVIAGIVRALKPGGRFAAEFGGAGNVAAVVGGLTAALARRGIDAAKRNPWYFPEPDEYRRLLERHGLAVTLLELFPRPTPLPGSLSDWLATFGESFLHAVPPDERPALSAEVETELRPQLFAQGTWTVDYVRLRVAAKRVR